jgi:PAS domain S-box-containing protein
MGARDESKTKQQLLEELDVLRSCVMELEQVQVERKRAEVALRESEEAYKSIRDNIQDGYYEVDIAGNLTLFNDALCRMVGYSRDELMGMNNRQLMDKATAKKVFGTFNRVYTTGRSSKGFDWALERKDGTRVYIETSVSLVRSSDGRKIGFRGTARDISERKRAEAERERLLADLKRLNTQLQTAAEVSKSAGTILEPEDLMDQTVNLIRERFDFYYVGIFLVDADSSDEPEEAFAVLRAGTGEAGRQMLAAGHKLAVGGESMVGQCVANAEARIALDTGQEAVRFNNPFLPETHSQVALPLVARGKAIGALTVQSIEEDAFSKEDIAVLQTMADQLAIAIENARLLEASQRQTQVLAGLYDIALATGSVLETGSLLLHLYEQVRRLMDLDGFVVAMYDEETQEIEIALAMEEGEVYAEFEALRLPLAEAGVTGAVIRSRQPLLAGDLLTDPLPVKPRHGTRPSRAWLGVPLIARDRLIGAVSVQSFRPGAFDDADRRFLESVAGQVASALENARLFEQAQQEIAERKRAEEELLHLKEFNEGIVQNMVEGIVVEDAEGYFTFVNPAAAAMLGYSVEEMTGQHWKTVVPPDQQPIVQAADERRTRGASDRYEVEVVCKDGTRFPILISGSPRFEEDGFAGTLAVFTDLTERVRSEEEKQALQEKLARAQRMESLGVLAGGVAHELNNILGPLVGYPDLIMLDLPENSPLRNDLLLIKQSAERAAAVVQDLLTLARRGAYRMAPVNLNTVIEDYVQSPSFTELKAANPNVFVDMDLAKDLLSISGSTPHLHKVVMNLMLNAFEAMPYGGRLKLATQCINLESPIFGYDHIETGDYVVLQVSDAGVGIEEEDLSRLFEPFFTKKKMGRSGSGLGLAVVYGVVRDHKGKIDVHTELGRGTDFLVYFPVTRGELETAEAETMDCRGDETVLVVDDLAEQRELAARLLSSLGYRVETATSGQAAIEYLSHNVVDILVLDMILEDDTDGLDIYREALKIRPGQKAVIASGFSETDRVRQAQRLGAGAFVRKPYTLENIGQALRQELDQR